MAKYARSTKRLDQASFVAEGKLAVVVLEFPQRFDFGRRIQRSPLEGATRDLREELSKLLVQPRVRAIVGSDKHHSANAQPLVTGLQHVPDKLGITRCGDGQGEHVELLIGEIGSAFQPQIWARLRQKLFGEVFGVKIDEGTKNLVGPILGRCDRELAASQRRAKNRARGHVGKRADQKLLGGTRLESGA